MSLTKVTYSMIRGATANVLDFGAIGDGVANDTAAIQAALATGASVYIPKGTYLISSGLAIATSGQTIYGDGPTQSNILVSGNAYDAITISSNYGGVEEIKIYAASARSSGSFVNLSANTRGNFVKNFVLKNGFTGIKISTNAVITYIQNGEILDATPSTGTGIIINGGNDTFISHVVMDSTGLNPSCGLQIDNTQAVWVSDSDIIAFGTPLRISPNGGLVTWCFFSQFALDSSSGNGIEIAPSNSGIVKGLFFDNCWTSTNNRGAYITATTGASVDTVHFTDSTFYNSQLQGALVGGNSVSNIAFSNCRAAGNSRSASGTYAGIQAANDTIAFSIQGCRSGSHAGFANDQTYGVLVGTGCNEYLITGNDFSNNITNGALDNSKGTSTIRQVNSNLGYNTTAQGLATITSGTSSVTVSHGLAATPTIVLSTPSNTNLSGVSFWNSSYTATTLNINTSSNVASNAVFAWTATIY